MENEQENDLEENFENQEEIIDNQDGNITADEDVNEDKEEQIETMEIEKEPEEKALDESVVSNCISMLCKTSDGMNYAYVLLYCTQKALTNIEVMSRYIHLRYVDFSNNNISDISPLNSLADLITINCSSNRINSFTEMDLPYLRKLNLSNNRITQLYKISFPQLETLNLNGNKISSLYDTDSEAALQSDLMPELVNVELRGNLLVDTTGLEKLGRVKQMFLSKNKITSICGLENLVNLVSLHLRDNEILNLDGFTGDLQSLQYLNLRGNQVTEINEIRKLNRLSLLRALILSGNPVAESDEYRLETLTALRKLVRLDKDNFLDEERTEAEHIFKQRLNDEMLDKEKSDLNNEVEED